MEVGRVCVVAVLSPSLRLLLCPVYNAGAFNRKFGAELAGPLTRPEGADFLSQVNRGGRVGIGSRQRYRGGKRSPAAVKSQAKSNTG